MVLSEGISRLPSIDCVPCSLEFTLCRPIMKRNKWGKDKYKTCSVGKEKEHRKVDVESK